MSAVKAKVKVKVCFSTLLSVVSCHWHLGTPLISKFDRAAAVSSSKLGRSSRAAPGRPSTSSSTTRSKRGTSSRAAPGRPSTSSSTTRSKRGTSSRAAAGRPPSSRQAALQQGLQLRRSFLWSSADSQGGGCGPGPPNRHAAWHSSAATPAS